MSRPARVVALIALAVVWMNGSRAVEAQARSERAIALAQQLVQAAYGELRDKGITVVLYLERTFESDWTGQGPLSLTFHRQHHSGTGELHTETLLTARVWTRGDEGFLSSATFDGTYVHEDQMNGVYETIRRRPAISQPEIEALLLAQGARFPPKEKAALLEAARLERFKGIIGPFTVADVRFHSGAPPDTGRPLWSVTLRTSKVSRQDMCYDLLLEPFGGRLVHFIAGGCGDEKSKER